MEETTLFAEGPIKVTTAWVTGGGHDIPFPEVSSVFVRVSKRPARLARAGAVLGLAGLVALLFGSAHPTESSSWLLLLGGVTLPTSVVLLVIAMLQAYPLQRELVLTVSGRNVPLLTSTNLALLQRAAEAIAGSLPVPIESSP